MHSDHPNLTSGLLVQGFPGRVKEKRPEGSESGYLLGKPRILFMDESCSALDLMAAARVEDLIHQLKKQFIIVIVTHNMQQASRVSDKAGFFLPCKLV